MRSVSRLFVVRHGNTFMPGEPARRIGARTDLPLVASGVAQAEALAGWFQRHEIRFERAMTGPLARTLQTAALILEGTYDAPRVERADWLVEIDHGPDENQPDEVVSARIGTDALAAWDMSAKAPPGWRVDAEARIRGWRTLLDDPPPGNTLLVTSNGAARFVFSAYPALRPAAPLKLRTGALAIIDVEGGNIALTTWDLRP